MNGTLPRQHLPDPADTVQVCFAEVAELRTWFARRALSPVEYIEAILVRIEALNPSLRALVDVYGDEAREGARASAERYAHGRALGPLDGVTVAIKDETPVAGKRTTSGSERYADHVDMESAVVVDRIRAAGGIIHARTATPEFCTAPFTHSPLWGISRNPWNPEASPGGSSGGAGAALAAGLTSLADGSDIGGSIRIPAAFCGVVGFRPPYGRVPGFSPYNLDPHCVQGPLGRSVDDCAELEQVMAGMHPVDPVTVPDSTNLWADSPTGLEGMCVAVSTDCGGFPTSAEVVQAVEGAAEVLRSLGAIVETVEVGWTFDQVQTASSIHAGLYIGPALSEPHDVPLTAYAAKVAERALSIGKQHIQEMLLLEGAIQAALADVHASYDVLICPTVSTTHLVAGEDYVHQGPLVDGVPTEKHRDVLPTLTFSICSRNPVLSIPVGMATNGVPIGMQVVGKPFDDSTTFRVGRAFQKANPWPLSGGATGPVPSVVASLGRTARFESPQMEELK